VRGRPLLIQNIYPISFGHNGLHCLPVLNGATGALGNFPECLTNTRAFVFLSARPPFPLRAALANSSAAGIRLRAAIPFLPFPGRPSMSDDSKRRPGPKPYAGVVRTSVSEPGDEQVGAYSYEQRVRMDEKFTPAVERAFANGSERRQSAAMNGANASRPR